MNNLPEIRDIYIPDGVSVFPLATGWWFILAAILFIVFFLKFLFWGVKTSKKYYALKKLKKIDTTQPVEAAIQMSELLRRICTVKFQEASSLYGEEWINFLNQHTDFKISGDKAKLLMFAPFMSKNDKSYHADTASGIKEFCRQWIGANL